MPGRKTHQIKETKVGKDVKKLRPKSELAIPLYSVDGKDTGSLDLPKEIFNTEASPKLLAQYIRVYLANRRQGTASTKTRGEVKGSTRKIYRQKGTGRARHGDIKAPIFVGGGIVGGPKPRDYSLRINKKQIRKALFYALSLKLKSEGIVGLSNDFIKVEAKTKRMFSFLKSLNLNGKRILLVLPKREKNNLVLAMRNLPNITIMDAVSLNAYEVLKNEKLLLLEQSLKSLEEHFLKERSSPKSLPALKT